MPYLERPLEPPERGCSRRLISLPPRFPAVPIGAMDVVAIAAAVVVVAVVVIIVVVVVVVVVLLLELRPELDPPQHVVDAALDVVVAEHQGAEVAQAREHHGEGPGQRVGAEPQVTQRLQRREGVAHGLQRLID